MKKFNKALTAVALATVVLIIFFILMQLPISLMNQHSDIAFVFGVLLVIPIAMANAFMIVPRAVKVWKWIVVKYKLNE
jgi:NAD/NADP transhydrogenase beta subunit